MPRPSWHARPGVGVIALDLTRLLSRAARPAPTGIDRIELAYARYFAAGTRPACFAARTFGGRLGLLPRDEAIRFIRQISAQWLDGDARRIDSRGLDLVARRLRRAALVGGGRGLRHELGAGSGRPVYLTVSHLRLERAAAIARLKARCGARFVCMIHDLIPLELPQYTRPSQVRRHRRRVEVAAGLADAVIVNSRATEAALRRQLASSPRLPPIVVAPPGIDLAAGDAADPTRGGAYFVCLGTIEPRKNHGLLFEVWRRLAASRGDAAPRLVVIGQRGWHGDRIMAAAARLALVEERSNLPDAAAAAVLRGARALLMPSFAEGFGLPVAEALAAGVPVLCSDLPALREYACGAVEYLDPADADAWLAAICAYAMPQSPRRQSQLARFAGWQASRWQDHFTAVDRLLADLT